MNVNRVPRHNCNTISVRRDWLASNKNLSFPGAEQSWGKYSFVFTYHLKNLLKAELSSLCIIKTPGEGVGLSGQTMGGKG